MQLPSSSIANAQAWLTGKRQSPKGDAPKTLHDLAFPKKVPLAAKPQTRLPANPRLEAMRAAAPAAEPLDSAALLVWLGQGKTANVGFTPTLARYSRPAHQFLKLAMFDETPSFDVNNVRVSTSQPFDVPTYRHRPVVHRSDSVDAFVNADPKSPRGDILRAESIRQTVAALQDAANGKTQEAEWTADLGAFLRRAAPGRDAAFDFNNRKSTDDTSVERASERDLVQLLHRLGGAGIGAVLGGGLSHLVAPYVFDGVDDKHRGKKSRRYANLLTAAGLAAGAGTGWYLTKQASLDPRRRRKRNLRNVLLGMLAATGGVASYGLGSRILNNDAQGRLADLSAMGASLVRDAGGELGPVPNPSRSNSHDLMLSYVDRASAAAGGSVAGTPVYDYIVGGVRRNVVDPLLPAKYRLPVVAAVPPTDVDALRKWKNDDSYMDHYKSFSDGPVRAYLHQLEKLKHDKYAEYSTLALEGVPLGAAAIYRRTANRIGDLVGQATMKAPINVSPDSDQAFRAAMSSAVKSLNHGQQMDILRETSQHIKNTDPVFWSSAFNPAIKAVGSLQGAPPRRYAMAGNLAKSLLVDTPKGVGIALGLGGLGLGAYGLYNLLNDDYNLVD